MDGRSAAAALALYLVFMVGSEGKALAKTEGKSFQCLCDSTHSKFIPPKAIQNVRLNQRGPHCQNVEIIAQSNPTEACLCLSPVSAHHGICSISQVVFSPL
uniref:Chemokine interleukin-8-like domain-containing protein n=1 Tax=Amazona collaria TaxID=241587 RepID=A0A8B9F8P7_9PSIT